MRVSTLVLLLLATFARGVAAQPQTDPSPGKERLTMKHSEAVNALAFSPDGKRLASAGEDGTVKVWDASTGENLLTLEAHTGPAKSVAFSPDGKRLASAGDEDVKVWDAETGKPLFTMDRHTATVQCVAFSPDGKKLASASDDETVMVSDSTNGRELLKLEGHSEPVLGVVFTHDGKRLASGGDDGAIIIWDSASGENLATLRGHESPVDDIAFSPDGKLMASACWDHTAKIWNATTGEELHRLEGHVDNVYGVDFRSDGKRLATASRDGWVKVWDTSTGQNVLTLTGRQAYFVIDVSYSPDDSQLASAGSAVRIWTFKKPGTPSETPSTTTPTPAPEPPPASPLAASRTWTDSSGQFKIKAKFIRMDGAFVLLTLDADQKEIRVPVNRLSDTDRALLKRTTGQPKPETNMDTAKPSDTPEPATKPDKVIALKKGVLAQAGFNLSRGAGLGEQGWSGPWATTAADKVTVADSAFEGDGAVHLQGTVRIGRRFASPLTGTVEIEQYVRYPAGGQVICYVWEKNHASSGPMWTINDGEFRGLDGNEQGSGNWTATGESAAEDEWVQVVIEINTENKWWKLKLPDRDYVSPELKFRGAPKQLLEIHYLAETPAGIFLDAVQVREAKPE